VTAGLQQRIHNMAATREAGNKLLSSQIDKLRCQLDKSKKLQHQSQAQVGLGHQQNMGLHSQISNQRRVEAKTCRSTSTKH